MNPKPLDETVRQRMSRQARRNTQVELQVRRRLHSAGYRYRVDYRPDQSMRCRGDIVFTRRKVIVFIDGCFWHGCPLHATQPKNNADWWRAKLASNVERDRRHSDALHDLGWRVLRFWEHEDPADICGRIVAVVRALENSS